MGTNTNPAPKAAAGSRTHRAEKGSPVRRLPSLSGGSSTTSSRSAARRSPSPSRRNSTSSSRLSYSYAESLAEASSSSNGWEVDNPLEGDLPAELPAISFDHFTGSMEWDVPPPECDENDVYFVDDIWSRLKFKSETDDDAGVQRALKIFRAQGVMNDLRRATA